MLQTPRLARQADLPQKTLRTDTNPQDLGECKNVGAQGFVLSQSTIEA